MYKSILLVTLFCLVSLAAAGSLPEAKNEEVRNGMRFAFQNGLNTFGGSAKDKKNFGDAEPAPPSPKKPFSQYTQNIKALGGGKPALAEQYRLHKFIPQAPSVLPIQFDASEKMTPEEAAKIYVPQPPLQYTTDRVRQ